MTNQISIMAIIGMILGVLSIILVRTFFLSIYLAIFAIIISTISLIIIKKNKKTGKDIAITGLVTGILGLIAWFFMLLKDLTMGY